MKKILAILTAVIFITTSAIPAFACGSRHGAKKTAAYSVCDIENCVETGLHTHNKNYYYAHYYNDGHIYHDYCAVEDCTLVGYHSHDDEYCFSHAVNDGHDYHDYCGIVNCTLTGYHEHDGVYCFGHTINDGHKYHRKNNNHH